MFRFTIRDVLWLTTLVAMTLAWVNAQFRYFMAVNENKRQQERLDTLVQIMRSRDSEPPTAKAASLPPD
jgi:hypothetical protein